MGRFKDADNHIYKIGIPAIRTYLSAFCIMSINILYCTYFQSVGRESLSVIISVIRGFLLNVILLMTIPSIVGGSGIWIVVPITELITYITIKAYCILKKLKVDLF